MTAGLFFLAIVALAAPPATHAAPLKPPVVDYPPASLKAGEAGRVGYSIIVTERGTVKDCKIIAPSGFQRLDRATCDLLRGTIYAPATEDGKPVPETKRGVINWTIPAVTPASALPAEPSQP